VRIRRLCIKTFNRVKQLLLPSFLLTALSITCIEALATSASTSNIGPVVAPTNLSPEPGCVTSIAQTVTPAGSNFNGNAQPQGYYATLLGTQEHGGQLCPGKYTVHGYCFVWVADSCGGSSCGWGGDICNGSNGAGLASADSHDGYTTSHGNCGDNQNVDIFIASFTFDTNTMWSPYFCSMYIEHGWFQFCSIYATMITPYTYHQAT
jgi:hypothetical protein